MTHDSEMGISAEAVHRDRAALVEGSLRNLPVCAGRPDGDQFLISGIVGVDAEGRLPPDFRSQVENVFTLEGHAVAAPSSPLMLKKLTIHGIGVGHRQALEDLIAAVDRTGPKPLINARDPFAAFSGALDHLDRGGFAKIVVELA